MSHIAESVALSDIWKIENYLNTRALPLDEILKETGASWGFNGLMWDGPNICQHLKVNGSLEATPDYTVHGYAWNDGPDIHMRVLPNIPGGGKDIPERNMAGGVALIVDGKPVEHLIYAKAQGGIRGRTAFGMKAGRFCAYVSEDGSGDARTPEGLRDLLASFGWQSAVMVDCGGSSQGRLNGREVKAARIVKHVILVYLNSDKPGVNYRLHVNAYSRKLDGEKKVGKYFKVREFACQDGSDPVFIAERLPVILDQIRERFGPVRITSGYRTPPHNTRVNGKPYSQHLYGAAADIAIQGVSPRTVGRYARSLMPNYGGIGVYRQKGFTHIDVREEKADW